MTGILQNAIKTGFFVISGRNQWKIAVGRETLFEKTKPIASLRPEIRGTKLEIRNRTKGYN
jgi:hypothetical protein